ncbi:MAG: CPBP family intramembrane metalloprotease [Anaerolineaceae bacterium]|nr:MAG: CPBP family intramembrane metalloprotease [Anaerolineaceae bacterium]
MSFVNVILVKRLMEDFISERLQGLILAFTTSPSIEAWLWTAGILLLLAVVVLPIGFRTGFLRVEPMAGGHGRFVLIALTLIIRPSLIEELIFRILFVPHPAQGYPPRITLLWAGVGLFLFIVFHPINGLFVRKGARLLFTDPLFLVFAGLLGIGCTAAYLISGSIWPPMIIHWVAVTPWILLLGGGNALFLKGNAR